MIRWIIRLESLMFFLAGVYFYYLFSGNWILFILILLIPDISMAGYIKDTKIGALTYNLVHNYILSVVIFFSGYFLDNILLIQIGIIIFCHISLDRFFGFGLKKPSGFKDTHLDKIK